MHPFPHHYAAAARATPEGDVTVSDAGLPDLACAPPAAFDGPGDRWSPETLVCAAVASCFTLTFRAIARARKIAWSDLACTVDGTLDRTEGRTAFTALTVHALLQVPAGTDRDAAMQALERSEHGCLVSNSLAAPVSLDARVEVDGAPA